MNKIGDRRLFDDTLCPTGTVQKRRLGAQGAKATVGLRLSKDRKL